jgi:replicative DNA helicase
MTITDMTKLHSLDAEKSVIGALILDNDSYDKISDQLTGNDFYHTGNRILFKHIEKLSKDGIPYDVVTLSDSLTESKQIDKVGGLSYIGDLVNNTPTAANIWAYSQIVKKRSIRRNLQKALMDSNDLVFQGSEINEDELLDQVEKNIIAVRETLDTNADDFQAMNDILGDVINQLDALNDKDGTVTGLATGFTDIDEKTAGLHEGQLIIVAGRPSMGKTTFAMNIAENVLKETDKSVLLFSMEMPAKDIVSRMISSMAKIPFDKIRRANLEDEDWASMMAGIGRMNEMPLTVIDTPALTPIQIKHKARKFKRENPSLGLIVVDYLQLMRVPGLENNRNLEVSHISGALKAIAKELNVPVIAISQLNRAVDDRTDKRPMMSDLRDSGAIEQDADVIMFVFREEVYKPDNQEIKGIGEIIIGKQRNGAIGSVKVTFRGEYCRFDTAEFRSYEKGWD